MSESGSISEERSHKIGEAFGDLSEEIAALVREELERARADAVARAREAGKAGGLVGLATVFGVAAGGAALALPALVLKRALSPEATALAVGGLYGAVAFAFARRALERLEAAAPEAVEERIEAKKEDLNKSLKERMPRP
jgi:hypothetical protein